MEGEPTMNLALSYHTGAREQTLRWLEWVRELGGLGRHTLYTICAFDCEPVPDILPNIKIADAERLTGDWQAEKPARSAAAPNSMLRTFAWKFYLEKLGPWLFIEPDAIPLKPGWIDILEAEYISGKQPFMGNRVLIERVPEHMTGNGIYPQNTPELAPTLLMRTNWKSEGSEYELAFDIAGAKEILRQAHFTPLIQHIFRHPGFKTREEFDVVIDPNAVVFHSCKDGSIFQFLGTKNNTLLVDASPAAVERFAKVHNEAMAPFQAAIEKGGDVPCPPESSVIQSSVEDGSNGAATVQPSVAPNDSREALVHDAVAVLKQLCTSPVHTGQVRKELRRQAIIK